MIPLPNLDVIAFLVLATFAVLCGLSVILQKHAVASALSLVGVMGALAVLYLMLGAEFLAAVQMIVYAGAIMVLFVFVIMLLNAGSEQKSNRPRYFAYFAGIPALLVFLGLIANFILRELPNSASVQFGAFTQGGPAPVGRLLFTKYLLPFEVTSLLVLIAIIGAMVLAKKEID
ncbi:MAG: NADH-quinone oxidoreductase subunit J [Bryobacteraceae bacterium]|nr:NADH-quinone oxidoreductase subunit J [Bryobacteraceae bacterium]